MAYDVFIHCDYGCDRDCLNCSCASFCSESTFVPLDNAEDFDDE